MPTTRESGATPAADASERPPAGRAPGADAAGERPLAERTPEELAVLAQGGRRDALDLLAAAMRPRLRGFLVGKVARGDDVDDLVQETFLRAFSRLHQYDPRWRFSTWLCTIGARIAIDRLRGRRPGQALPAELADGGGGDPAAALSDRREGERLWQRARELLDDRAYAALYLRYARDLSIREIAGTLGITVVHTRVVLHRARQRLAREVK